jgi:L-ribulokinase
VPASYDEAARQQGISVHQLLERLAAQQSVGESGLLALDWWNGNRSVLVDVDLSGLLIGATLGTRPEEIYRALIEATAFGTRMIIDTFEQAGVEVREIVAAGGLPDRNKLLMQVYADVTGREIRVAASKQAGALGAAMFAAVAAGRARGGYDSIQEASIHMASLQSLAYRPMLANRDVYDRLYAEYERLHDYFGRGENDVMKTLLAIRDEARGE